MSDQIRHPTIERVYVERRRGKDWITKGIEILSGVSWVAIIAIFVSVGFAKPQGGGGSWALTNMLGQIVVSTPNYFYYRLARYLSLATFLLCLFGFVFNIFRHKRKTDRYRKSLIIFGVVSLISFVYWTIRLG